PKGSYSLFTLPSESGWKLIVNKVDKQWGAFDYNEKQDLGRVDMKVGKTSKPVEQFTITLAKAGKGAVMKMEWENTSASVDLNLKGARAMISGGRAGSWNSRTPPDPSVE